MNVTVIATNTNITLRLGKESVVINKTKSPKVFEEVIKKIEGADPDIKWLEANFSSLKSRVESVTKGVMSVKNNQLVIKGTDIPVPALIVEKLKELENNAESIEPLLRFWRKLCKNPSENSRRDLYDFMQRNKIPITETGDIVVEKGVNQKTGSYPGHLVDVHTGCVDNSVGMVVTMPREKVNSDSTQTCSHGLHVGAPDYVRKNWTSDVIVECIVDPADVVSVPKDYNATKMRVCAYKVMGYSDKSRASNKVVSLNDFLLEPLPEVKEKMEVKSKEEATPVDLTKGTNTKTVKSKKQSKASKVVKKISNKKLEEKLNEMSARGIVEYVKEQTGEEITISLKSKKAILKKALALLSPASIKEEILEHKDVIAEMTEKTVEQVEELSFEKVDEEVIQEEVKELVELKTLNTTEMGKSDLIKFLKDKFNEDVSFAMFKSRDYVEKLVIDHARKAGYKVNE